MNHSQPPAEKHPRDNEPDPRYPDRVPGINSFGDPTKNDKPWFKRWYVWLLPAAVLFGVVYRHPWG
jgi:hypothetical protein